MFVAIVAALLPAAGPGRIPPKLVTVNQPNGTLAGAIGEFTRQAGIPINLPGDAATTRCPVTADAMPAWEAVERVADQTRTRIELRDRGRSVALVGRLGPSAPASVDGPFRVAVRQVRAVRGFDPESSVVSVALDIHWEPRVTVFRLDAEPTITVVGTDIGGATPFAASRSKTPPDGAHYQTTVNIEGVPRAATSLIRVAGSFIVTVADRMLDFRFPLAENLPAVQQRDGVTVSVVRAGRVDERYEVEVTLTYPPSHPEFESFESFVTGNRATLVAGGKAWPATDPEVISDGRRVTAVYRFPAGVPAGATFEYTTPAPLAEYPVRFDLRDIPLP